MTFTPSQLIRIGRLFVAHQLDTDMIKSVMRCDEQDIYNALTEARRVYRVFISIPEQNRKEAVAAANRRWRYRNKALNAELRREARI
jgi:hypothetical protein